VDWVFRDHGATGTYQRALKGGASPFQSVFEAQAHNPSAQEILLGCRAVIEAYLARLGARPDSRPLSRHQLGARDCRCISIEPVGEDHHRRAVYRVTNSCDGLLVAVQFAEDILSLTASPALSSWAHAGQLMKDMSVELTGPDRRFSMIAGVAIENAVSTHSCRF
jgi:hypothetical protein